MTSIFDFDVFPIMETLRLVLREMTQNDAEAVYSIFSDPEVMPENIASTQLLHKLGFHEEGIRREYGFWGDTFHDLTLFSLLKREYVV